MVDWMEMQKAERTVVKLASYMETMKGKKLVVLKDAKWGYWKGTMKDSDLAGWMADRLVSKLLAPNLVR